MPARSGRLRKTPYWENCPHDLPCKGGPKGTWGETVYAEFAANKAYTYLAMASYHMKTVRLMLVTQDVRVSLAVIARCLLELGARVYGLLKMDLNDINDDQAIRAHAARIALECLEDAMQGKRLADKQACIPGHEDSNATDVLSSFLAVQSAEKDIRERFTADGIKKLTGSHPEHRIVLEESVPRLTDAVANLAETKGSNETEREYAGKHLDYAYTFLTGSTHPTVAEALRLLGVGQGQSSMVGLVPDMDTSAVDVNQADYLTRIAISNFLGIWSSTARYFGLDAGIDSEVKKIMPWLDGLL